jgi:hypothetical protein
MRSGVPSLCVLLACILAIGCGGGRIPPSASLAGTWQFNANSSFGYTFTGNVTFIQSGSAVSGQINLNGSSCGTIGAISGSISGRTVTLQMMESGQAINMNGNANSSLTSLSGNYTAPSGSCTNGDSGTWSATKIG